MQSLSKRRIAILRVITDEYIATVQPVGSEVVSNSLRLKVSSATVRHEMAALEEEGFIIRPHVSAGGIPADKGYRLYVQGLLDGVELSPQERMSMWRRFEWADRDAEAWTRLAALVLSELVHNMAIATFPRATQSRMRHLELVYFKEVLVLLILVLQGTRLRKELVSLEEPVEPEELVQVANKLNAHFAGLSEREIAAKQVGLTPLEDQVLGSTMRMLQEEERSASEDYLVEGLRHLLAQPEFLLSPRAQEVVEALEDRRLVQPILNGAPQEGGLRLIIGEENPDERLKPLSMVMAPYGMTGEVGGVVGIIGPTRMEYKRTIAGVRYLSSLMSDLVVDLRGGTASP